MYENNNMYVFNPDWVFTDQHRVSLLFCNARVMPKNCYFYISSNLPFRKRNNKWGALSNKRQWRPRFFQLTLSKTNLRIFNQDKYSIL